MTRLGIVLLLLGVAAVLALPPRQPKGEQPSWWPKTRQWPPQKPATKTLQASEDGKISIPDWLPSHPEWIPWPPSHPESIPWPPSEWFPEDRPSWWPEGSEWPPQHPEWIPWPPQHPDWIPWPPQHPEWIPWPPQHPEWIPWPPQHPEWIPWPPEHPEWIPWPPQHPEWIPWPPAEWFPEDAPQWWPEGWPWPPPSPPHPEWIPWPPSHPEWIPWPPTHPEWIPWPPSHPGWLPTEVDNLPYQPSRDNQFHLFTRANPSISQPLIYENSVILGHTNFDPSKKIVVLVHNSDESAVGASNVILVPALLNAGDVNVIVVDWSAGANANFGLSSIYSVFSGRFIAEFVTWLSRTSGADLANFHLVGYGIGGLNVGFIGRLLEGKVGYVTALNPSQGRVLTALLPPLTPDVAQYTEVIHTSFKSGGYTKNLGHVDFFPNGGKNMPGCAGDAACNNLRSVYYFAESLQGGQFIGLKCENYEEAVEGQCEGPETLNLGGLEPKTGTSGVFFVPTNAYPPFAQG